MRFADQVVVVTGGSAGIGLACARGFLREGARRVYITGRRQAVLDAACAELGDRAVGIAADVASMADIETVRAEIASRESEIHVVVANAGVSIRNEFGRTEEAEFDRTFDINVKGLFFTVQSLLPLLVDGGAIVLIASVVANKGRPQLSLYNASKAAVRSFARSFASDLRDRGIRVNACSPGVTRTDILLGRPGLTSEQIAEMGAQIEDYCRTAAPLGRSADPDEIAEPVLFLASTQASYITGVELGVDGGMGQV